MKMNLIVMKQTEKSVVAHAVLTEECRFSNPSAGIPEGFVYARGMMGTVSGMNAKMEEVGFELAEKEAFLIPVSSIAFIKEFYVKEQ